MKSVPFFFLKNYFFFSFSQSKALPFPSKKNSPRSKSLVGALCGYSLNFASPRASIRAAQARGLTFRPKNSFIFAWVATNFFFFTRNCKLCSQQSYLLLSVLLALLLIPLIVIEQDWFRNALCSGEPNMTTAYAIGVCIPILDVVGSFIFSCDSGPSKATFDERDCSGTPNTVDFIPGCLDVGEMFTCSYDLPSIPEGIRSVNLLIRYRLLRHRLLL